MSKGFGLGRGGRSVGGGSAVSGELGPAKQAQSVISKLGGVARAAEIPYRKEFERGEGGSQQRPGSIKYHTEKFAVATTTAEKNKIATSGKPIRLELSKVSGRWYVGLTDGRHRLYGAKAAGATRIRAEVTIYIRGQPDRRVVTNVRM